MVVGLDRWQAHFKGYEDRYALVGGVACDRLMDDAGLVFRGTKDLDVVLIVELLDAEFAKHFWAFVEEGGYDVRARAEGGKLHRFQRPKAPDFPYMIELFSRLPDGVDLAPGGALTPIPVDEAGASLSAILLDADYYAYLKENLTEIAGLPVLTELGLIPFKARAYLDLSERKAKGDDNVDSKTVNKHRNDVMRLIQLLAGNAVFDLPEPIAADMRRFLDVIAADEAFEPKTLGLGFSRDEAIARLARAFKLTDEPRDPQA